MILIPAIDLKDGCCVRLLQGDFDAQTRYEVEPRELLARYERAGAPWVHLVDLDGARDGDGATRVNRKVIRELAAGATVKLQVGGGLRDADAVRDVLDCGAARVVVGSAAVTHVPDVRSWFECFGSERMVLAFDVRLDRESIPRVALHGWRAQSSLSLWDALANFSDLGLKHVLCTDVGRDGTLAGPNVELYAEAARPFSGFEWQASGGIRDARDIGALALAGAAAAISGKALLENLIPTEELRPFLPSA